MTFRGAITHQKHLAQSGRSTRSAVDIFNTLRVFTKEPTREQEINLECMNKNYHHLILVCYYFWSLYSISLLGFTQVSFYPFSDIYECFST